MLSELCESVYEMLQKTWSASVEKARRAKPHGPMLPGMFDESKHPREPAGSGHGGQFTHLQVQSALSRYANRAATAQGGGLFGGEDMQSRHGFAKLPHGTPIVFTHGEFEGHTGKIVRDEDPYTGAPRIVAQVDGRDGLVPISPDGIEPLEQRHSWRTEGGGTGREEIQGALFSAEHYLPNRNAPGQEQAYNVPEGQNMPASLDPNAAKNAHLPPQAREAIERYYAARQHKVRVPAWLYTDWSLLRNYADGVDLSVALAAAKLAEQLAVADLGDAAMNRLFADIGRWIRKHPDDWRRGMAVGFYHNLKPGQYPYSGDD